MSPECQGGLFQRLGSYSTAHNDVWSLGVILVNLACGRNPWKQACPSDETFRAYLANPDFLRSILPISDHTNRILKRVFALNPQARIGLAELRAEIMSVKTFVMTEDELKGATRATREAARAFAQVGKKEEQQARDREAEEELRLEMQEDDAQSGYTATTEDDDDSHSSPPISPFNSRGQSFPCGSALLAESGADFLAFVSPAGLESPPSPATPTQHSRSHRTPPTPPHTPRRTTRQSGITPPPRGATRISPSSSSSSSSSLSPCPSSNSSTLASDSSSSPSRYTTPPQHSRSVFNPPPSCDDADVLPPSPVTPSLRRPRKIPVPCRRRKTSADSSSSSSGASYSQPPTPTYPTAQSAAAAQHVRIVTTDDSSNDDLEMVDASSKASYTAYYPVFADWADSPEYPVALPPKAYRPSTRRYDAGGIHSVLSA